MWPGGCGGLQGYGAMFWERARSGGGMRQGGLVTGSGATLGFRLCLQRALLCSLKPGSKVCQWRLVVVRHQLGLFRSIGGQAPVVLGLWHTGVALRDRDGDGVCDWDPDPSGRWPILIVGVAAGPHEQEITAPGAPFVLTIEFVGAQFGRDVLGEHLPSGGLVGVAADGEVAHSQRLPVAPNDVHPLAIVAGQQLEGLPGGGDQRLRHIGALLDQRLCPQQHVLRPCADVLGGFGAHRGDTHPSLQEHLGHRNDLDVLDEAGRDVLQAMLIDLPISAHFVDGDAIQEHGVAAVGIKLHVPTHLDGPHPGVHGVSRRHLRQDAHGERHATEHLEHQFVRWQPLQNDSGIVTEFDVVVVNVKSRLCDKEVGVILHQHVQNSAQKEGPVRFLRLRLGLRGNGHLPGEQPNVVNFLTLAFGSRDRIRRRQWFGVGCFYIGRWRRRVDGGAGCACPRSPGKRQRRTHGRRVDVQ
mmetsp:Transcript_70191/g.117098  ORF Transcript_70191/g.117098 Transcript_70191/m.117098 type:complete len:469 (+) Transcript_70191:373-1779(+)